MRDPAVVQLASRLGLRTIGEGVERRDQQQLLAAAGVTSGQGPLYLDASPAEQLVEWLGARPRGRGAEPVVRLADARSARSA